MPLPPVFIIAAGALHLVVASANLFAFRKFHYLEYLRGLPTVLRQVFLVQNAYIMLVQTACALLCFRFAAELTSGHGLGQALAIFLAVFWGSRVLLQLFYYDRKLRRDNRVYDVLFLLADGYLAAAFALAAALPGLSAE
jgi:hypothetical protein